MISITHTLCTLSVTALLLTTSLAAESVHSSTNCPVFAGEGSYSYDPTTLYGPSHWGDKGETHTCSDGIHQSPIDFPMPNKTNTVENGPQPMMVPGPFNLSASSYNWAASCMERGNCGHTILNGKRYDVVNAHFHTPSEHMLNGKRYPLESHIVHASADGSLAVIATLFDYPNMDEYASKVHDVVPKEWGTNQLVSTLLYKIYERSDKFTLDLGSIIKPEEGYCVYVGSLTTPPCSEGVTFMMAMHTETVTERQVAAYRITCGVGADGNNRPVMPLNGRSVTCYV